MPYAYSDAGQPVEIVPGQAFTTTRLKVAADEAALYGVDAGTVIDQRITHGPDALDLFTDADRDRYQITFVELSLPAARAQQFAALQSVYDARRQSPMTWDFGQVSAQDDAGADHGAAGVQQLQMRDVVDTQNWLAAAQGAAAALFAGEPAEVMPLKVLSNLWVQTTAAQVVQVLVTGDGTQASALARGRAMLARFGSLKAEIAAAADAAACLAIDVAAGWPA